MTLKIFQLARRNLPLVAFITACVPDVGKTAEDPASEQGQLAYDWRSYAQLTAEDDGGSGMGFGADRIRYRGEASYRRLTGGFMVDFGEQDLGDRRPGALANVIGDLYLNYRPDDKHVIRLGQFKTPLGMDYNIAGRRLDITKRGMEAGLVLNRDLGIMLSGRRVWRRLGYDIGVFNPAGRSAATTHDDSQVGEDITPVVRLHYDEGRLPFEAARGQSQAAAGPGTRNYDVGDVAMTFRSGPWTLKTERTEGRTIRGIDGWDERVYYVHGAYRPRERLEFLVRHYEGASRLAGGSTQLQNTFVGLTAELLPRGRLSTRLQVNYVVTGGDEATYTGLGGYRDNALLVQLQIYTQK